MINHSYSMTTKMAFVILVVYSFFSVNCTNPDTRLNPTKLVFNIPIVKLSGELINLTDSLYIFSYNNYIIYKFPYTYSVENDTALLSVEVKYNFFGYRLNDKKGLFASTDMKKQSIVPVDSILALEAFSNFKFFDPINDSLVARINSTDNDGCVIEKYASKIKYDDSYPDTTYLFYSGNFKKSAFSFSNTPNSQKNSKVFKIIMRSRRQPSLRYKIIMPEQEYRFELKEAEKGQLNEVNQFLDSLTLKLQ